VRYLLDNPYKYVVVKPAMVISIGLTEDTEVRIEKVGFSSGNVVVPKLVL
jgi:hypothetical protein